MNIDALELAKELEKRTADPDLAFMVIVYEKSTGMSQIGTSTWFTPRDVTKILTQISNFIFQKDCKQVKGNRGH